MHSFITHVRFSCIRSFNHPNIYIIELFIQSSLGGHTRAQVHVEIRRVLRLDGNPLLKVSPTLQVVFSIPPEKKLLAEAKKAGAEGGEVCE